jgi:hypothetical protein
MELNNMKYQYEKYGKELGMGELRQMERQNDCGNSW